MRKIIILFTSILILSMILYSTNLSVNLSNFTLQKNLKNPNFNKIVNYSINKIPAKNVLIKKNKSNLESLDRCKVLWRYSFECALCYALNKTNLEKVENLAKKLDGSNEEQKVWNVLKWEGKNLKYNWSKATLPPTVVEYYGNKVKIIRKGIWYQTPEETIKKGNGICGDYAILTSALLIDMNLTPYPSIVNFTSGTGHAATLVRINGWYFVLDQHLPPMDLGTYYKEWLFYRVRFGTRKIVSIHLYKVVPGKVSKVMDVGEILAKDMIKEDYKLKKDDLKLLAYGLAKKFEKTGLKEDPNLKGLKPNSYLPPGYTSGLFWTFNFPHYADYYNPVFYKQYVNYFFSQIYKGAFKVDAESSNSIWINVSKNNSDIVFHIILAKKY